MRDPLNSLDYKELFPPKAAVTDNTAQVSNIIDLANTDGAAFILLTGTDADADATFAVTGVEGNDAALADGVAIDANNLIGTMALAGFTFADDNKTRKVGYKGSKRYVQLTVTPTNNTGNLFLSGVAVLSTKNQPSANPPT